MPTRDFSAALIPTASLPPGSQDHPRVPSPGPSMPAACAARRYGPQLWIPSSVVPSSTSAACGDCPAWPPHSGPPASFPEKTPSLTCANNLEIVISAASRSTSQSPTSRLILLKSAASVPSPRPSWLPVPSPLYLPFKNSAANDTSTAESLLSSLMNTSSTTPPSTPFSSIVSSTP